MRSDVAYKIKDNGRSPTPRANYFERELSVEFCLTYINEGTSRETKSMKKERVFDVSY